MCAGEVKDTIKKLSKRATSLLQILGLNKELWTPKKSQESKLGQFQDSFLGVSGKSSIRM
jgi:hypothetical protein